MSLNNWIGGATAVAQVDRFTPATVEVNDIFTLTATGEDGSTAAVSFTATVATVANVTAGLTAAWNVSTNALHTPISATDATTSLTLTADTPGIPFSVAATTTNGGAANTQTLTRAAVTANAGDEDFNTASNWATGSVPVNGDSWDADGRSLDNIRYGLDQSAKTFALVRIFQSFSKTIGALGGYKLKMGCTNCLIGEPAQDGSTGSGSSLINISFYTVAGTARVKKTRNTGTSNKPPVQLLPNENTFDIIVEPNAIVGIGTDVYGETVAMNELHMHGGRCEVGVGTTFGGSSPAINQTGGDVILRGSVATINQDAGTITTEGSGTITTANIAGTLVSNSTGTITTLEVKGGGVADFTQSTAPRTVTNGTVVGTGARINANNGKALSVTWTTGVDCIDGADTTQVSMGDEVNVAFSAA